MTGKRWMFVWGAALLALATVWQVQAAPLTQGSAERDSCRSLGLALGVAVAPEDGAEYSLTSTDGDLSAGAPEDASNSVKISALTDTAFNWTATLGVDAVIVHGVGGTRTYHYEREARRGRGLAVDGGDSGPIRQVEFCYDYELTVGGEVATSLDRAYQWDLRAATRPSRPTAYIGDSATVEYLITVAPRAPVESNWAAEAHLYLENHTPYDATIDGVSFSVRDVGEVEVQCNVEFPYTLQAGYALACVASTPLPDSRARSGSVEVAASGEVQGGATPLNITFSDAAVTAVGDTVRVQDGYAGALGTITVETSALPVSFSYERTFECSADAGTHEGNARIVETGQEVTASVEVTCLSQGCDPSFWQRAPQLTRWENFTPEQDFDSVFRVDLFDPDVTLLEALSLRGDDGVDALAREAAAALLNVGSEKVRYLYSLTDLRNMVQEAAEGQDHGRIAELLGEANVAECPFVRRPVAAVPDSGQGSAQDDAPGLMPAAGPAAPGNPAPPPAVPTALPTSVPPTSVPTVVPTVEPATPEPTIAPTAVPPTPVPTQPPAPPPPPNPAPPADPPGRPDDPGQPGPPPGHDEGKDKGKDKDKDKGKKP